MTHLVNDAARFAGEALAGFAAAHPELVRLVPGAGVVRSAGHAGVAVVMGGGSGHHPAFAGWVGPGIGSGAVAGNVFSSPSASQIVDVTVAAAGGTDVLFVPINYSGDMLHFGEAARRLQAQGYDVRTVAVTDDIATPVDVEGGRRGIAGSFIVLKIVGAAAQRGDDLDGVDRIARKAVGATRTLGVAFTGCTLPGATAPGVQIAEGVMTVGLGIHGEPGLESRPLETADATADLLVDALFGERAPEVGGRVAVLVNGLGATTPDELYVVFGRVAHRLRDAGMTLVAPVVDELVTSLDMAGLSLSLTYLDDELAELWQAPARTAAFTRGKIPAETGPVAASGISHGAPPEREPKTPTRPASVESKQLAALICDRLGDIAESLTAHAAQLGELDAVAGDGDHGACMQRGSSAALTAAQTAVAAGAGAGSVLAAAAEAWSDVGGGTSGALWGAGLQAAATVASDDQPSSTALAVAAVHAFVSAIVERGGAQVGDKTMVDALIPFAETLRERTTAADPLDTAWIAAADVAHAGAQHTATFTARRGRSRTHGDASIGTPDPGAVSFAIAAAAAGRAAGRPTTGDPS
ncbi:L-erythrulose kinase [Mycolicibacterium murale]|uniref:L-erythrulose kinase n=1 Tax=Mycolicibacterium murale TaxID=182220 RepID=A0A7I9WFT8_9MYCO|nr:dihydroxyacetone kinase family protein [Mycolicibacterium murale]MCV7183050.1 dihydroxyacetone kinase family protein [Mycolicibacterium murale]GFG56605.1 L-erythrulose kinase [Mycolicibacterium murale]